MGDSEEDYVERTLIEWGLQDYVETFSKQKIDRETFLTMPKDAVTELIPPVGPRFTFLMKREKLLVVSRDITDQDLDLVDTASSNSASTTLVRHDSSTSLSSLASMVSTASTSSTNKDSGDGQKLRSLLNKSITGRFLLTRSRLSSSDRNSLCGIIIEHMLTLNFKISPEQFKFWTREVTAVFKYEDGGTYYVSFQGGKTKRAASGKLYDKYTNLKRRVKKAVLEKENDSTAENRYCETDAANLIKLYNASLDDYNKIKDLWVQTYECRDRDKDIASYYERYPQLSTPIGSTLIVMDYEQMHLPAVDLTIKWPTLVDNIILLAKEKSLCVKVLENIEDNVPSEIIGLRVLPYLFRPTLCKTGNKKKWKPSMQEQADGFILWINVLTDLEKILESRLNLLSSYNLTCQPIVVAVGPLAKLEVSYVIINEVKYKFANLVSAVDFCFKSFYALNAKFPVGSEPAWQFLQLEVYEIPEKQKQFVSVQSVRSDLRNLMDKNVEDSDESD